MNFRICNSDNTTVELFQILIEQDLLQSDLDFFSGIDILYLF